MARIEGVPASRAPFLVRIAYWFTKREVGRLIQPVAVHAHHPRLLRGLAGMEMAQKAARTLDPALKTLAGVRVAMRIGCPF